MVERDVVGEGWEGEGFQGLEGLGLGGGGGPGVGEGLGGAVSGVGYCGGLVEIGRQGG